MNMAQNFKFKEFSLGISLFMAVLSVNHGFYTNFAAVLICFLGLLAGLRVSLHRIFFIFALLVLCIFLMFFLNSSEVSFSGTTPLTVLYFALFSALILMGRSLDDDFLAVTLKIILILLLFIHIIQLLIYMVFGIYLDLSFVLFGDEARYGSTFSDWPRFSTIYEEPSTYASVLILLGTMYYILTDDVALPNFAFIASMSTLSIAGVFIGLIALIFVNCNRYVSFVLFGLILLLANEIQSYLPFGSYYIRMNLIHHVGQIDGVLSYVGTGLFGLNSNLTELTNPDLKDDRIASLNDLGSLLFVYVKFGYLGVIVHLFILLKFFKKRHLPLVLLAMLGKLSILHPLYLILFSKNYAKT